MLRVYSVLYIERLWNSDDTVSQNKHLIHSSNSSTHSQIIVTDAYASREIEANEHEQERGVHQENPQEARLQEQEPLADTGADTDAAAAAASAAAASVASQTAANNTTVEETEMLGDKINDESTMLVDSAVPQQRQNEYIINSLAIDTNNLQDFSAAAAAQAKAQAEAMSITEELTTTPAAVTEKSADLPTSISSSSSILPPLTPSSVHSIGASGAEVPEKPRTTSLIRRETQKLNDKRKSFTKKMKRVLTVKSDSKRNSV
ncbi:hypothetical protein [Parasitella parasitica]|uniref:Uncharacterized protein n=1 Tax=Parasitella parasitica TaxID=35722 RepID=A0A0B7N3R0_9FUNG|nr:hypothetical protein [Parasitella parasitica]